MKPWIPTRRELPGLLLVFAVGTLAWGLVKLAPRTPYLSDLIVAILLGGIIVNTPLGRLIGLGDTAGRDSDPYERGLRYTGKFVLRLAIILMGFKIQTDLFRADQALVIGAVLLCAIPSAFFLTHAAAQRLGLRREMGDLLAIGTMVCGASAINALAPVINARRRDQGLAITAVFIFTLVALLTFLPTARAVGLPDDYAGLWAGLAVNDLSGAVAVGSQFGEDPSLIATAAKSVRIILLGPMLIGFSVIRRGARTQPEGGRAVSLARTMPLFILGYFACFGGRLVGDATLGGTAAWAGFLDGVDGVVGFAILAVCAGIGLHINIRVILELGWKAVVSGAVASAGMAGLSVLMLLGFAHDLPAAAIGGGAVVVVASWGVYRVGRGMHPERSALGRRFASGAPLSIREAVDLLEAHDIRETLTPQVTEKILRQLSPAIGELQPLRQSAVVEPVRYRRIVYWKSKRDSGTLVGVLWPPGTRTRIHSHHYDGLGKTIEGHVRTVDFERAGDRRLRVVGHTELEPGSVMEFRGRDTVHAVQNPSDRDAIDIHFYGPPLGYASERFDPAEPRALERLEPGSELSVEAADHELPAERVPDAFWER